MQLDRHKIGYMTSISGSEYGLLTLMLGISLILFPVVMIFFSPITGYFSDGPKGGFGPSFYVFIAAWYGICFGLRYATKNVKKIQEEEFGSVQPRRGFWFFARRYLFAPSLLIPFLFGGVISFTYIPAANLTLILISATLMLSWIFISRPAGKIDLVLGLFVAGLALLPIQPYLPSVGYEDAFRPDVPGYYVFLASLVWGPVFVIKGIHEYIFVSQLVKPRTHDL